jgi:hypothetical protein
MTDAGITRRRKLGADRSKVGRGAKAKGKAFERTVARGMSSLSGLALRRVPDSGAQYWDGDIWFPEEPRRFGYVVECRYRPSVLGAQALDYVLAGRWDKPPLSWLLDAQEEAASVEATPILVWKAAPRHPIYWTALKRDVFNYVPEKGFGPLVLAVRPAQFPEDVARTLTFSQEFVECLKPRGSGIVLKTL